MSGDEVVIYTAITLMLCMVGIILLITASMEE
jgi:hypothetical protein